MCIWSRVVREFIFYEKIMFFHLKNNNNNNQEDGKFFFHIIQTFET